ncbi:D-alanyl-D-alanine carboxypeptidase family protein [Salinibacterium sp. ZJ70]|uniref:D-alanyl-D-alanine carboxypeptidase family protein n=1 Tax=Salinibacterium sp. ZJ70 TaxID=2708084 RepID=UPI00141F15C6|nr:D-alanyl-D-alanine carboxypeptidase [Salinibacterium sp. ZJ70]
MPLTRAQIYRRRRIAVFGAFTLLVSGIAYLPLTLFAPVSEIAAVVTEPTFETAPAVTLTPPAAAASAISAAGEGVLVQTGSPDPLPIASITKLITALVVLDAHPLAAGEPGPMIRMTDADAALYRQYDRLGASVAPVQVGAELSERQVIEVMLIDSAGNYAVTLVNWAFGSEAAFLDATRAWLADNALTSVVVTEPTGRDPGNVATASDLLRIGELALEDPALAEIVAISRTTIDGAGEVVNSNKLLGYEGIDGIKTGTLNSFGANLLYSGDIQVGSTTIPVVGVVLGAATHGVLNDAVRALYTEVRAGYREVEVVTRGEVIGEYATRWEESSAAIAADSATLVVWSDTPISAVTSVDPVGLAPADTAVGELAISSGPRSVSVPLVLSNAIEDPGPWWRLSHPEIIFGMG